MSPVPGDELSLPGHEPVPQKRGGQRGTEVSVRCSCGGYQTPWRGSRSIVVGFFADHLRLERAKARVPA